MYPPSPPSYTSTSEASIVLHHALFLQWGNRLSRWVHPGSWRLAWVSAPVVAMPDDDQLSDLASVLIRSHPHLAQIRSRSHHGHRAPHRIS